MFAIAVSKHISSWMSEHKCLIGIFMGMLFDMLFLQGRLNLRLTSINSQNKGITTYIKENSTVLECNTVCQANSAT